VLGQSLSGEGPWFRAACPLTDAPLEPLFFDATEAQVHAALVAADAAFDRYAETTAGSRALFLESIADEIMALGDTLLERTHQETGLPLDRLTGERGRTTGQLRMFAEVLRAGTWEDVRFDAALPDRKPLPRPDLRRMLHPLGPVVVFGASNFPFAYSVAGGDTASALAAGNPVVVKAHPAHPGTSELTASAILAAVGKSGMPAGVFGMVHGASQDVGLALVRHPLTKAVGFTGSRAGGRALFDAASARPEPVPVFAEMSSLNPLFLLPGALAERGEAIADGLKGSVLGGVGQFCTKPGLVFAVAGAGLDSFLARLSNNLATAPVGIMLHAGIAAAYRAGVEMRRGIPGVALAAAAPAPGSELRTHGRATLFVVSDATFREYSILREELFGPSTTVIVSESVDRLIELARELDGQLTAAIHGTDAEGDSATAKALTNVLRRKAGRLIWNGYPTGVEVAESMVHGGPYPATTDERFTAVGAPAILRFARPVCYQGMPTALLPAKLAGS
jgi:NADP-dependent aldehyde dehydrogenase